MRNDFTISNDGINVYIDIISRVKKAPLIVLGAFLMILLSTYFWGFNYIIKTKSFFLVLPAILVTIVTLWFPLRYFLWNLFGSETLIISTKSVSWSYDYGFIQIPLKTVPIKKMNIRFDVTNFEENEELGIVHVYKYIEETNLPEHIHKTTLTITQDQFKEIRHHISEIYRSEFEETHNFIAFSDN